MGASVKPELVYQTFYQGGTAQADIDKINAAKKARETAQQQAIVAEKIAMDVQKRPMPLTEAAKLVEGTGVAQPTPLVFVPIHTTTDKGELVPFVTPGSEQSSGEKEILGLPVKTWAWIVAAILLLIILIVVAVKMSKAGK